MRKSLFKYAIIYCLFCLSCSGILNIEEPRALAINEGFQNPIGFYDTLPSFSWKLPVEDEVLSQTAYQIVVGSTEKLVNNDPDLWDSKKTMSDQSTFVQYKGKPLHSRQKVYWKVRFWNQSEKVSDWSAIQSFELGLVDNDDWQAQWITIADSLNVDSTETGYPFHKIQHLRKEFEIEGDVVSARLYTTAKGVFQAKINGINTSSDIMPPGWTPYHKRIETLTYDVGSLIHKGNNCIAFTIAPGWYSGRLGWEKAEFGKPPELICQLDIEFENGESQTIISDQSWKGSNDGPYVFAEIYDGEVYDARMENKGWDLVAFDDEEWSGVVAKDISGDIVLEPKRHSTVRSKDTLLTQEIATRADGSVIFDLGQNMVGVPLINVPMKKDDTLVIRFAEMLNQDGSIYTENYRSAHSTDYYIADQDGMISWKPTFTFHGFRYVSLTGFDLSSQPEKEWVQGEVQYSNFIKNGHFTSSDEKLNQLQSNIVWGLRGNFFDIPTDCPQRDERLGWTGDAQVFAPTSLFNADVHAFWASWLKSMREEQGEEGQIPFVVPNILSPTAVSSGWGDAAAVIPWELYMRTGDIRVLRDNYNMMKKWVSFHKLKTTDFISEMNSFADWLQPFQNAKNRRGDTPKDLIGTAYYAYSVELTKRAAQVLGEMDDYNEYEALHKEICKRFESEFFSENGEIKDGGTQTGYLLALAFDLLSDTLQPKVKPHLLDKISEADNHLRTGFLGTPLLPKVLDELGEVDLMYTILFKETYPSWFYSINQGATTMWERWNSYSHEDGFGNASMNSFNHYAYGAIGEWMYERIAGLSIMEPGYKKVLINPIPGGPLTAASASYDSKFGKISSAWNMESETFNLEVILPPNTTGVIRIPFEKSSAIYINGEEMTDSDLVVVNRETSEFVEVFANPGRYNFMVSI